MPQTLTNVSHHEQQRRAREAASLEPTPSSQCLAREGGRSSSTDAHAHTRTHLYTHAAAASAAATGGGNSPSQQVAEGCQDQGDESVNDSFLSVGWVEEGLVESWVEDGTLGRYQEDGALAMGGLAQLVLGVLYVVVWFIFIGKVVFLCL